MLWSSGIGFWKNDQGYALVQTTSLASPVILFPATITSAGSRKWSRTLNKNDCADLSFGHGLEVLMPARYFIMEVYASPNLL